MTNDALKQFFEKMSEERIMLTYDDVRLRTRYSEILPADADLSTKFSRNIALRIPIVSSPMDTVTTAEMAVAMAEAGGIGIIHRGPSPEMQAKEISRVKNRLNGKIEMPIVVQESMTMEDVQKMRDAKKFSFHTFPVVNDAGKMVGLITRNDFDFCSDFGKPVKEVMTAFTDLATAPADMGAKEAFGVMLERKKKVLPLVREDGRVAGMFVFSDLKRILSSKHEHNLDSHGQLIVGAAIGAGEKALVRAELLAERKCDVFHLDTAHGDSKVVIETVKALKKKYSHIDVVAGNVSSGVSAKRLADAGADGVLVGQGPGSICTTRVVAGIGVPQVSALFDCTNALEGSGVPVIADGGINNSGDMVIALAVGASSVMLGRLLAGTEEAPGETKFFQGMQVKDYRGMGSLGAMRENASSRERYGQADAAPVKLVPEGVEGIVPYKGRVRGVLDQYTGGIRSGMGYNGAKTLAELSGNAELFRISPAGLAESHPHDVTITAQAPNYQGRG